METRLTFVAKKMLTYAGDFAELGYDHHPNALSLAAARGKRGPANKEQVLAYLRSATTLIMSPGREVDVFDESKRAGPASIMTDGVYAWSKTLAHYVEMYDVELSAEFEKHMERSGWVPAPVADKLALELPRYS